MTDGNPLAVLDGADRLERRAKIAALEAHMQAMDASEHLPIDDMTDHYFASGAYVRTMRLPKGVLVVGKIHATEHICILLQGVVRITTEMGSEVHVAPKIMVCPPGLKRVAYAIEDAIWANAHAVGEERDLDAIEARLIAPSFEALEAIQQSPRLEDAA